MPKESMRAQHMELLDHWRDQVVREDARTFDAADGGHFKMSLTGTCLGCHPNKVDFCDQCHTYPDVQPDCWNCHVDPERGDDEPHRSGFLEAAGCSALGLAGAGGARLAPPEIAASPQGKTAGASAGP